MGAALRLGHRQRALVRLQRDAALFLPADPSGSDGVRVQYPIEGTGVEAACTAIRRLLSNHEKSTIDVHLACGWSRLLLLPWTEHLTSDLRWRTVAQARFEQVFGESTQTWEIHVARDLPGRDRIAVAWPHALRAALAAQRNVRSVRVGLLEHLGVLLEHEPVFSGCLIEIESDGAGFVLVLNGRPRRVRWSRFSNDEGLSAALRSEWASVVAAETERPRGSVGLGLIPPAPEPDSARASTIATLAAGLESNRAFSLPEWP